MEAYDFVDGDYVYIGKGTAVLSALLPVNGINIALYFHVELVAYEPRFEGVRSCEVHMRGMVSDKDPIEGKASALLLLFVSLYLLFSWSDPERATCTQSYLFV